MTLYHPTLELTDHPALSLIGAPYCRGGTDVAMGFDCFTLLAHVRRVYYGRPTPVHPSASKSNAAVPPALACARGIYRTLCGGLGWYEQATATPGCAVALGRFHVGRLHHCGVALHGGVLHSAHGLGVCFIPGNRVHEVFGRVEYFECAG